MTENRDFKRLVRERMQKTGESYTTARTQLLAKSPPPGEPEVAPGHYAELAGVSEATMLEKTGRGWKQWVDALDAAGASSWPHKRIAEYVHLTWEISGWWAQTVTVGYERVKGLRQVGQRRDGTFEANKSRTFPVGVERLFEAFADEASRSAWLGDVDLTVRTAKRPKSMRIAWDDDTSVELYFISKGDSKSSVAVQHRKLGSQGEIAERKIYWDERFDRLADHLGTS